MLEEQPETLASETSLIPEGAASPAPPAPLKRRRPRKQQPEPNNEDPNIIKPKKMRYFRVIIGEASPRGRYRGYKPKQAATKAYRYTLKKDNELELNGGGRLEFSIIEWTRGSKNKTYHYVGEKIVLEKPCTRKVIKDGKEDTIEYKYNYKVMKRIEHPPQPETQVEQTAEPQAK